MLKCALYRNLSSVKYYILRAHGTSDTAQDDLLLEVKAAADEGFQRAKEEWGWMVTTWGNECFHPARVLSVKAVVYPAEKQKERSKAATASVEGSPYLDAPLSIHSRVLFLPPIDLDPALCLADVQSVLDPSVGIEFHGSVIHFLSFKNKIFAQYVQLFFTIRNNTVNYLPKKPTGTSDLS